MMGMFLNSSWRVQHVATASGTAVYLFSGVVLGFYSTSNGLNLGAPWRRMTQRRWRGRSWQKIWLPRWALRSEPSWPRFWSMWHAQDNKLHWSDPCWQSQYCGLNHDVITMMCNQYNASTRVNSWSKAAWPRNPTGVLETNEDQFG